MLSVLEELVLELDPVIQNLNKIVIVSQKRGVGKQAISLGILTTRRAVLGGGHPVSPLVLDAHTPFPGGALTKGSVHWGHESRAPGHLAGHSEMLGKGRKRKDRRAADSRVTGLECGMNSFKFSSPSLSLHCPASVILISHRT